MTVAQLTVHRHPSEPFEVSLPATWTVQIDPRTDVSLIGLDPEPDPWGFRGNVVVAVEELDRGITLQAWQQGAETLLPAGLFDYYLLDLEPVRVGDRAGLRRLAHHDVNGRSVTMEQWVAVEGARGYTLTTSVSTLAYAGLAEDLAAIAATFRIGTQPSSNGHPG